MEKQNKELEAIVNYHIPENYQKIIESYLQYDEMSDNYHIPKLEQILGIVKEAEEKRRNFYGEDDFGENRGKKTEDVATLFEKLTLKQPKEQECLPTIRGR